MASTLLQICAGFARRQSLPVPTTVVNSTDETILQLWGILNEEVEDLADRFAWKELTFRASFNHIGGPDYLAQEGSSFSPALKYPIPNTLWSNGLRIPVAGPLNPQQWSEILALSVQPAQYVFRWAQTGIWIYPVPPVNPGGPAPLDFSIEYVTSATCFSPSNSTYTEGYQSDDSYSLLPDRLVTSGLTWRYRASKGFPYAEDQRKYEDLVAVAESRNGNAAILRMDNDPMFPEVVTPGLMVPIGSWNQP